MILVDTSVWIDHVRKSDPTLSQLLGYRMVLVHPFVVGELAVGSLNPRHDILRFLQKFPEPVIARHDEALHFLSTHKLFGLGIGFIDLHLLASSHLTPGAQLWTRDKRLQQVARNLKVEYLPN